MLSRVQRQTSRYQTMSCEREPTASWLRLTTSDDDWTSCETKPESCDERLDSWRTHEDSCNDNTTWG